MPQTSYAPELTMRAARALLLRRQRVRGRRRLRRRLGDLQVGPHPAHHPRYCRAQTRRALSPGQRRSYSTHAVCAAVVRFTRYCARVLIRKATFRRLCRARDALHEGAESMTVAQLAAQAGISQFHFIRQFEALFGATPHQLRTQLRVEQAKRLLLRDQGSVTSVCMDVGFSSLGSFSSMFARHVGMCPSEYRRYVRGSVQVPAQLIVPGCFCMLARLPAEAFRNFGEATPSVLREDAGA